jgi:hypothetical protein
MLFRNLLFCCVFTMEYKFDAVDIRPDDVGKSKKV